MISGVQDTSYPTPPTTFSPQSPHHPSICINSALSRPHATVPDRPPRVPVGLIFRHSHLQKALLLPLPCLPFSSAKGPRAIALSSSTSILPLLLLSHTAALPKFPFIKQRFRSNQSSLNRSIRASIMAPAATPTRERKLSVGAPISDLQGPVGPGFTRPKHKRTFTGFGPGEIKNVEASIPEAQREA